MNDNTLEILDETARFEVDPQGAYVTRLCDEDGRDILAPYTIIEETQKKRGGCHVCLPYFGPDVAGRPQHGFGRDLKWRVEKTQTSVVAYFDTDVPGWEGFRAKIEYQEGVRLFSMKLTVFNGSSEVLRVSPGFHPYFALSSNAAELDGAPINANGFGEAQFIEGPTHTFKTDTHELTLHSDELQTWALWSDRQGDYFCVEPTFRGNSFAAGSEPLDGEVLQPGEERSYSFTIAW